ncbi:MAG: carboxypeptidase-like regulatory domain-containing protein [Candidatus Shapirobacteria bacterium]|nr:carboxypeptidase-like regulatory domain-containing protein [Candidatus Shapirobacteria bacterium]
MEQHPVPQNIASYEFHLIGDMTLKQFAQLAAGTILGLIIYAMPMPSLFKWPLIVVFGFLGFAFAFLPINERPLSDWLIAFFKAIFLPTEFVWQKKLRKPEIFEPLAYKVLPATQTKFAADKSALNQYLATLPFAEAKNPLDQQEESFLKEITNLFQLAHPVVFRPVTLPPFRPTSPTFQPSPEPIRPTQPYRPVILPQKPGRPRKTAVEAKINPELLIPTPPTRPNLIVGMVLDQEGKIMEGAILEIRNTQGTPVRALRTSRLGQFMIATPLTNGLYEIETEKEGYQFDIIKIEAKGEIIKPIEIRAKSPN